MNITGFYVACNADPIENLHAGFDVPCLCGGVLDAAEVISLSIFRSF